MVPVLVGGASLPTAADLPEDVQALAQRQAVMLHDETWRQDLDGLVRSLRGEPVAATKWRRHWLAVAAAGVTVIGVGAAGWAVWGSGYGNGSSDGSGGKSTPRCAAPNPSWNRILLSKDPTGEEKIDGGSLVFTVNGARWRPHGKKTWQVTLDTSMENKTTKSQYLYNSRYRNLWVAQRTFNLTCFGSTSPEPLDPKAVGDALIGFDVTCKPVGRMLLGIEDNKAQINVTPKILKPGEC